MMDENRLSSISKADSDEKIGECWDAAVFLCHNAQDKADVRAVRRKLEALGIRTWFDEEQLRPGMSWQVVLEEQIAVIESAAVFVGRSGIGPWQSVEMRAFLSEFVSRRCPVIPVILASAKDIPELPIFLRQLTWVDFRENPEDALLRLVWGITGQRPEKAVKPVHAKPRIKPPKRGVVKSNGDAGKPRRGQFISDSILQLEIAYEANLTSPRASPIITIASRLGATGFDRGRNVRRDACRAVSTRTVIKSQGNTNANSNELALAA